MIPMPNVIAGILIGAVNDTWIARVLVPFCWGGIFIIYKTITMRDERKVYAEHMRGTTAKWGMTPIQAYYFIEYGTATATSLIFSVITGAIKALF